MVYGQLVLNSPDTLLLRAGIKPSDRFVLAEQIFFQNLDNAKKFLSLERQQEIYQNLSLLYEKSGDNAKAYAAYKNYKLIADSVEKLNNKNEVTSRTLQLSYKQREDSISFKQQIARTQLQSKLALTAKEVELQQANYKQSQTSLIAEKNVRKVKEQQLKVTQVDDELKNTQIKNKQRQSYYLLAGIAALIGLSFFIARNYINQRKSNKIISKEKQRSDDLLLNILPADVAEELKEKGSADAKLFDEVTVLFTDFVNFTTVSQSLTPQQLVDELNVCFKEFDGIMTTHHIEKIKTVGDAYLAVSGLPNPDKNHAANVINAAKDIQQFMLNRKVTMGDKTFGIRLGVHSGSVVAGIVGVKKFAYDIWGDTVNTAARMEQNSEPGKINVSEKTYELVKDQFTFTYRGEIAAKNKGMMKMYFAEQVPALAIIQTNA
jgi:class 3 adenylate cyclase